MAEKITPAEVLQLIELLRKIGGEMDLYESWSIPPCNELPYQLYFYIGVEPAEGWEYRHTYPSIIVLPDAEVVVQKR